MIVFLDQFGVALPPALLPTSDECREAREALGWSAEVLAVWASARVSDIQVYEAGSTPPDARLLTAVRKAFLERGIRFDGKHIIMKRGINPEGAPEERLVESTTEVLQMLHDSFLRFGRIHVTKQASGRPN
jgi:hypothetical protein